MFDFLDSDWFIISLEIIFLAYAAYEAKKYFETKNKEYLTNVVLAIAFFIWAAIPFYNSYVTWEDSSKQNYISECIKEDNASTCECIGKGLFKEYSYESYIEVDQASNSDFTEFLKETREDCLDD